MKGRWELKEQMMDWKSNMAYVRLLKRHLELLMCFGALSHATCVALWTRKNNILENRGVIIDFLLTHSISSKSVHQRDEEERNRDQSSNKQMNVFHVLLFIKRIKWKIVGIFLSADAPDDDEHVCEWNFSLFYWNYDGLRKILKIIYFYCNCTTNNSQLFNFKNSSMR